MAVAVEPVVAADHGIAISIGKYGLLTFIFLYVVIPFIFQSVLSYLAGVHPWTRVRRTRLAQPDRWWEQATQQDEQDEEDMEVEEAVPVQPAERQPYEPEGGIDEHGFFKCDRTLMMARLDIMMVHMLRSMEVGKHECPYFHPSGRYEITKVGKSLFVKLWFMYRCVSILLRYNCFISQRSFGYLYAVVFCESDNSTYYQSISDAAELLGVPRVALRLESAAKGWVRGNFKISANGLDYDGTRQPLYVNEYFALYLWKVTPVSFPPELKEFEGRKLVAAEKWGVFGDSNNYTRTTQAQSSSFFDWGEKGVIVNSNGHPSIGMKACIKWLEIEAKQQFNIDLNDEKYSITDNAPSGCSITSSWGKTGKTTTAECMAINHRFAMVGPFHLPEHEDTFKDDNAPLDVGCETTVNISDDRILKSLKNEDNPFLADAYDLPKRQAILKSFLRESEGGKGYSMQLEYYPRQSLAQFHKDMVRQGKKI